ncbi:hypothetical protein CCMA1212_008450 [Trichoderma ghanense]|uniref:Uncharacterized protein n=1 Tax=Trichoderma ghanense TaxID=65468 RepID=A0ABY2GW31_9HYPO
MAAGRKGKTKRVRGAAEWLGKMLARCDEARRRLSRAELSRGRAVRCSSTREGGGSDSDSASGRRSRGRPGCEGQLSRWAVETNVAMDIRLGCGGSERSGKVQVNRIESMVVRRRELIQYGDVAGGKRSVAVAAVCGDGSHGTAASLWVRQGARSLAVSRPFAALCLALPCAGAGAAARYG